MQFGFVEVARKRLLRNDELAAWKHFDVWQILDALLDEFDSVGEGELAPVFFDDENVKLDDLRGGVFDKGAVTERERVAVHDDCPDWNFLRA